jgi:hypothetical protein
LAEKKKEAEEMAEAARDMEYEEFKAKYVAHIEGTAVNERAEV